MMSSSQRALLLAVGLLGCFLFARAEPPTSKKVEFNRDIRPILSDRCFTCHGPDEKKRKADLRLDLEEGAFADHGDGPSIVRGQAAKSELYRRLIAEERKRMPPTKTGRPLTPEQIDTVRRWIDQGAQWEKHWSLIAPVRRELPVNKNKEWARNPIDHFILAKLERAGLTPSPPADKATLIRRVTLDLTGLPPTLAEVDAFLKDEAPDAYEKVVDRLLKSPRYGERMAARWLDAARYADTNGYQSDGERTMWRWRDWVINAYNQNMPFDEFTIEQLAGDLLDKPTLDQLIATGFNRNHRGNAEGGIIPEEYAVEYVADRVETTSTVWLGLTLGCARCHDHKFDPFTQKEFYQLFAFFNNVPEKGKAVKFGNSPPYIKAPTPAQQKKLADLEKRLASAAARYRDLQPRLTMSQAEWEKQLPAKPELQWFPARKLAARFAFDEMKEDKATQFKEGKPAFAQGIIGRAAAFDGQRFLDCGNKGDFTYLDRFAFSLWIKPAAQGGHILGREEDTARGEGYTLVLDKGKLQLNLVKRWLDDAIRVETVKPLPSERWQHVAVCYDGSRTADGIKIYVDGQEQELKYNLDDLNQDFQTKEPLRIGSGGSRADRFHGLIDEVRVYADCLEPREVLALAAAEPITTLVTVPAGKRTPAQHAKVRSYFLEQHAPADVRAARRELVQLRDERDMLLASFPTSMVMAEMPTPRQTHLLIRGEYDKPGPQVQPGVPASLPGMPRGVPTNRLGFAPGWYGPIIRSPHAWRSIATGRCTSAPGWSRRRRISARRGNGPATRCCSTGWLLSSSARAGT